MGKCTLLKATVALVIAGSAYLHAQESETVLVVLGDELDTYWVAEKKVAPVYPAKSLRNEEEGCVAVGYVIEPDGSTSSHRAVVSFPSANFNESAIKAAQEFSYQPSQQNTMKIPVFTTTTFTYQISKSQKLDPGRREQLEEICETAARNTLGSESG